MPNLIFDESLDARHREALKELFYFHPRQGVYGGSISEEINRHGEPRIVEENGRLRILPTGLLDAPNLFALSAGGAASRPVGVLIYYRFEMDTLSVMHMSTDETLAFSARFAGVGVALAMLGKLAELGRQISGICAVSLPYRRNRIPLHVLLASS